MATDLDFERQIHQTTRPVSLVDDLFTTRADRVLRRVDELLDGRDRDQPLNDMQRDFLKILRRHQGKPHALAQMQCCTRLKLTDRQVRNLVQDLRLVFGVQIGASRDADGGGYYLITTDEEADESTATMQHQAISMLRTVIAMRGGDDQAVDKLLKSLRTALTKEAK